MAFDYAELVKQYKSGSLKPKAAQPDITEAPPSTKSGVFSRIAERDAEERKKTLGERMKESWIGRVQEYNPITALTAGAGKAITRTVTGLGQAGASIMGKGLEAATGIKPVMDNESITQFREETMKPEGVLENVGAGITEIGMAVAPGGLAGRAARAAGMGWKGKLATEVAAEGAGAIAQAAARKPDLSLKEAATAGAVGAAFPIAGRVLSVAGKAARESTKFLASKLSGVPKEAIEEALRNPAPVRAAIKDMAKNPEVGPQKILETAEEALQALKKARSDAYKAALEKAKLDKAPVVENIEKLKSVAREALDTFKIGISETDEVMPTVKTVMPKGNVRDLSEVYERIKEWDDFTPIGLDDLKQVINSYEKGGVNLATGDKQFNAVLSKIKSNIVDLLPKNVREMSQNYARQSDVIDDIRKGLSLDKGMDVTAMRKLTNLFNPRSDVYRGLINDFGEETANKLRADIAGLLMSKFTADGLGAYVTTALGGSGITAALTNAAALPYVAATGAASSPRLVGEAATRVGSVLNKGIGKMISGTASGAAKREAIKQSGE